MTNYRNYNKKPNFDKYRNVDIRIKVVSLNLWPSSDVKDRNKRNSKAI